MNLFQVTHWDHFRVKKRFEHRQRFANALFSLRMRECPELSPAELSGLPRIKPLNLEMKTKTNID